MLSHLVLPTWSCGVCTLHGPDPICEQHAHTDLICRSHFWDIQQEDGISLCTVSSERICSTLETALLLCYDWDFQRSQREFSAQLPWDFNWELGTYLPDAPVKTAALTKVRASGWAPNAEYMGTRILQHI